MTNMRQVLFLLMGWSFFTSPAGASEVHVMNLHDGAFGGFANELNNFNQVAGYEGYLDPARGAFYRGVLWDEAGNLPSEIVEDGQATSIDDAGTASFFGPEITGFQYADGSTQSYIRTIMTVGARSSNGSYFGIGYPNGQFTVAALGTPSGIQLIPTPASAFNSEVTKVNNNGVVLGHFINASGLGTFVYRDGNSQELTIAGNSVGAIDINDANTVLTTGGGYRRFSLDNGHVSALLPGDTVNPNQYSVSAINSSGAVIGHGSDDLGRDHVLLWEAGKSLPIDITSFLFAEGSPLIDAGRTQVVDINDHGAILGIGTYASTMRDGPFLLILPEPSSALILPLLIARLRRRR